MTCTPSLHAAAALRRPTPRHPLRHLIAGVATGLVAATLPAAAGAENPAHDSSAPAPFKAEWESLKAHQDPEWFRDAKFGIYTHWGPVTLGREEGPGGGEWYGREMYQTNSPMFAWHRQQFGDPHTAGYKDVIPKFTASKFDAEKWADLFVRAGAKFAGPVAVHHDNFAMWDSEVTPWNSVKLGPKRDITGELAKAYKARGLKFLTTFHHGFAWRYYEPSFQFDAADGKNSLLYTEPHGTNAPPSLRFQDQWLAMVMECVRKYEPDMIWFDFELKAVITPDYERKMFAGYYNWAAAHGKESAVAHKFREIHEFTGILDFERGREDKLVPYPWLTDTALGPWFNRNADPYRSAENLVHVLADIVSKNGCLLLNVGPQADGAIPERAEKMLIEIGDWLKINGEAIYCTRPWKVFGEGPTRDKKGGGFSERADKKFTPRDIRFTQSKDGATLYAIALGWPADGKLQIKSLAAPAGEITGIRLLGSEDKLEWKQTGDALAVALPARKPCEFAYALKIAGKNLKPVEVPAATDFVQPSADGSILLAPDDADLHGSQIRVEEKNGHNYIAAWDKPAEWASWSARFPTNGSYEVSVVCSAASRATEFEVEISGHKLVAKAPKTATWYDYETVLAGSVAIPQAGVQSIRLRAHDPKQWRALNVRSIKLDKVVEPPWMTPDPAAVKRWQDMRFGMFIHWGPVSLTHQEIGWSRGAQTPIEEYDNLYKKFNPVKFNPDEWAAIARASGMKYVVLTTKHHDGFCLFATKKTDYNIMNSPFHRDVTRELAEACRKQGVAFGTYYSVCDWHHPDFPLTSPGGKVKREKSDLDAYNRYLLAQIRELIVNCGPLLTIWNDVPQEFKGRGVKTIKMVRELQPDILINNRTGDGGDYDTPEQRIGGFNMQRPWESCMTISAHGHWAWGGPEDGVKPLSACLLMLIRAAGGDGNVLLNVGPTPEGVIEPCQVDRLKEIGAWLAKYGDSIYGTRGGPYKPTKSVASTRKGNTIYIHITGWPEETLTLPALPAKIVNSRVLTGGEATVKQTADGIEIAVPKADRRAIDTIVALELDKPAIGIAPLSVNPAGESLTTGKKAKASNVYQKLSHYGAASAVDDDENTRWATDASTGPCWLEVDLGKPQTFDRAVIQECVDYGVRVKAFELQYKDGSEWKTFHSGKGIGKNLEVKFAPVTARIVRLNITEGKGGPTIWEFQLFAPTARKATP